MNKSIKIVSEKYSGVALFVVLRVLRLWRVLRWSETCPFVFFSEKNNRVGQPVDNAFIVVEKCAKKPNHQRD